MRLRASGFMSVVCVALVLGPLSVQAQEPPPPPGRDSTELVFEREVFSYPIFTRRNPFVPLVAANSGGPRFEQLRLMGVIMDPVDRTLSVAAIGTSGVSMSEDGTMSVTEGDAWYVREGGTIGNVRIVEIRDATVVVDVEEFGLTDRRTMQLLTQRPGGTP